MSAEENIQQALTTRFHYLEGKIRIMRQRRIFLEIEGSQFLEVFDYAVKNLGFGNLCAITGLDEGVQMAALYHLADNKGVLLNIKTGASRDNPVFKTVTPYFPYAEIYEREMMDLLGIKIDTLSPSHRYPLPDDWPMDEFPLRKDWKPKDRIQMTDDRSQRTEDRGQMTDDRRQRIEDGSRDIKDKT
ncbi:MAG: NADH-quinone oxidoreductase subunit C [Candidatus Omnitrophota bacterium]